LFNHSDTDFAVKAGDRVAQLVLERIEIAEVLEVAELDDTSRGAGECARARVRGRAGAGGRRGAAARAGVRASAQRTRSRSRPPCSTPAGGFGSTGVAGSPSATESAEKKARTE